MNLIQKVIGLFRRAAKEPNERVSIVMHPEEWSALATLLEQPDPAQHPQRWEHRDGVIYVQGADGKFARRVALMPERLYADNICDAHNAALRTQPARAPVQGWSAGIPWSLHLEAYAAYCAKYSAQPALIDLEGRGCRGGFHTGELDVFVPGWRERASEIQRLRIEVARLNAALMTQATAPFVHRKSQGLYDSLGPARLQTDTPLADMAEVVVYRGQDGRLWARAKPEFEERFDAVHPGP